MRRGYTMIELIAAVVIAGILLSLALVSLGGARASARLIECHNRVRQHSLAIQQFEGSEKALPTIRDPETESVIDPWISLDPYIELQNQRAAIEQGLSTTPNIYSCPSDTVFGSNYRMSHGNSISWDSLLRSIYPEAANGPVIYGKSVKYASVTDGLSHTAVVAERLAGIGYREPRRSIGKGPPFVAFGTDIRSDTNMESYWMAANWDTAATFDDAGVDVTQFGYLRSIYNHSMPPNSDMSCAYSGDVSSTSQVAFLGPTSLHRGVVVISLLDGSTHSVTEAIDVLVWRALGSIADSEASQEYPW